MKLYTINATPVRTREQIMDTIGVAMPSNKVLSDSEVASINEVSIREYPSIVSEVLASYDIDGFTIYKVDGYWKGEPEVSFKIEVATDNEWAVLETSRRLKTTYGQDAVMLTLPNNSVKFI